jgi:hypothetical protein
VATEQDAARLRVLAARGELAEQLVLLEASARAAVDIPAKIRRSPGKAAALAAGVAFLALKGPQRLFGTARTKLRGKPEPLPSRMLPDEIERTLRKLGSDGEKVRGTLERDFAAYTTSSESARQKARSSLRTVMLLAVVRPLLARTAKAIGDMAFSPNQQDFAARLAEIRERAGEGAGRTREAKDGEASAQERLATARGEEPAQTTSAGPADESAPTGI